MKHCIRAIRIAIVIIGVIVVSPAIYAESGFGIEDGSLLGSAETLATDDTSEAEGHPVTSQKAAFGMYIGFGPAIVGMDLRIGRVYSFLSGSLLIPLLNIGTYKHYATFDLAFGIGPTFRFFSDSWAFDVFATIQTEFSDIRHNHLKDMALSMGTGIGLRYVHPKGFSIGFKLPFFGLLVEDIVRGASSSDIDFLRYYFYFAKSVPVLSIGYTF